MNICLVSFINLFSFSILVVLKVKQLFWEDFRHESQFKNVDLSSYEIVFCDCYSETCT